jgi:predicted enzyme related to lactoylglutathione lyase
MPALVAEPGMPIWIDLATTDLATAKSFYADLLGWEFDDPCGGYVVAKKQGLPVAGLGEVPEDKPSLWGLMLYTPDVDDAYAKAVEAGAHGALSPRDVGRRGRMAVLVDPSGATIGFKQPRAEEPFFAAGEPGTPVWHELLVGENWDETLAFYHELAGWDIRTQTDSDRFRYATGDYDGAPLCGLWDTSELDENPSMWTLYLGCTDVDAAAEVARTSGGRVVRAPWDSELGRLTTIVDPTGALVNLCQIEEPEPESMEDVHEPDLLAPENHPDNH